MHKMPEESDLASTNERLGEILVSRNMMIRHWVKEGMCPEPLKSDYTAAEGLVADNGCLPSKMQHAGRKTPAKPKFNITPAGVFATRPLPGWIIKGLLPKAELAVVYGESGAGKSFFLIDILCAVARGEKWQCRPVKQGRVVYICAEGKVGFRKRLRAYAQHHGVDLEAMPLGVIDDAPNLLQQDDQAIAEQVNNWGGADVIVFDTLAQATPGANENSSEGIGKALEHCKRLHNLTGALIVLVAHTGKDPSKGVRGWSGIKGATDVQIEVVRAGDQRAIRIGKQKDDKDGYELAFRLSTVVIGRDEDGDEITSCVVEYLEAVPVAAQKKGPRNVKQKLVLGVVQEMSELGKGQVSMHELIEMCVSKTPRSSYGKCDNRRRDVVRAVEALVEANLIDITTGYVDLK